MLSKTYYNMLFGSSTRDRHARRIYRRTYFRRMKITCKAGDVAEYIELFGSSTRDLRHV